jgi:hypothetical protein
MIKITKENPICICGHYANEHGSYGTCYKTKHFKERKRNPKTNKYVTIESHFCCSCRKFEEYKA